jgi:hypothetical protein
MTECDEVAEGMRDDFLGWIRAEERELSHYAARRFVTAQMPDETPTIRDDVSLSLFAIARVHVHDHTMRQKIAEMDSPMAGSW